MHETTEFIRIEILFKSVEKELASRWANYNVPAVFISRPADNLRVVVQSWWQIYHESICARLGTNRCYWQSAYDHFSMSLDTSSLVACLVEIRGLVKLEDIQKFRPLSKGEEASMCLLSLLTKFYSNPDDRRWIQIL